MIIGNITQTGMMLETENNILSPQWSENLQIQVSYDDTFAGWSVKWDAINDISKKRIAVAYDPKTKCITLNKECFHGNYLYLACIFIKGKECHNTDPVEFYIPNSIMHGLNNDPEIPNLYDEMRELFQQIFDHEYREPLDQLFERNNETLDQMNATHQEVLDREEERIRHENTRIQQEEDRIRNEAIRVNQEQARNASENLRIQEENQRKANEEERIAKENERIGAETIRVNAEAERQSAEYDRQRWEVSRKNSESTREQQEIARQKAEEVREQNERNRINTLNEYQKFEEQCQINENLRVLREDERIQAENERVTAETQRQTDTSAAIERVDDVLKNLEASGANVIPIGSVIPFASSTAPLGWLICDGSAISRTEYNDLFSVIGTKYGAGNGIDTFNVPDLRGRVPLGMNENDIDFNSLGKQGGNKTHTLTIDELPSHTHMQNAHKHTALGSSGETGSHNHTASSNLTGAHTHTTSGTAASAGSHKHIITYNMGNSANSQGTAFCRAAKVTEWTGSESITGAHTHDVSGTAASAGAHSHTVTVNSNGAHSHTVSVTVDNTTATNQKTGGGLAHNNMQPYMVLNYIIKY